MSWLPTLAGWPFAAAGIAGAVATLLIHLLNRRRPRTIEWGAMDFLREALQKNQRTIRLRDAILLALRCLAIFLFGLALARPQFAGEDDAAALQPAHVILVLDNSLSMAFETLDGTLLGRAKEAATRLLDHVPPGSLISVMKSAGSADLSPPLPSAQSDEVAARIRQIKIADQSTDLEATIAGVDQIASLSADLPKRVVFFTDLQSTTWRDVAKPARVDSDRSWQLVDVSPSERENASIADITVLGGFAISDRRTTIIATVGRSGGRSVRDVEVRLMIDEVTVGSRTLKLPPGDFQQRVYFTHTFSARANSTGKPAEAIVSVAMTPDRLPRDDIQHAVVAVFNRWPVVFVDQFGDDAEDPTRGQLGETWVVRRLLAANAPSPANAGPQHVSPGQLSDELLTAARAVVVAGVRDPRLIAGKLQAFVESGGQLLIAAGGDFDPVAWNASAWLGGRGVLPAEFDDKVVGSTPSETKEDLQPWQLDATSVIDHTLFRLPDNSPEDLLDLYSEPLFFKLVGVDEQKIDNDATRILARLRFVGDAEASDGVNQRLPLLLERSIGQGRTLMMTTGLRPRWNTLAKTNAVVLLDRTLRRLVGDTLPRRDFITSESIEVPWPPDMERSTIALVRPNQTTAETIAGGDRDNPGAKIPVSNAIDRGVYRLTANHEDSGAVWNFPIAVNGPAAESNLAKANDAAVARFAAHRNVTLTNFGDSVSVRDMFQPRQGLAWWLVALVLCLLVLETALLTASTIVRPSADSGIALPAALPASTPAAGG